MAKSQKEEVKFWEEQVRLGEKFRKETGDYDSWDRWKKYYKNDFNDMVLPVNLIFSIGRSIIPRVYFRNPQVVCTPMKNGMQLHAKVVEALDNWMVRRIGMKNAMKKVIQDTFLSGTGLLKIGYDSEFGYDPEEASLAEEPIAWDGYSREEERPEYNSLIIPGMPWTKRVNPRDFLVPWGTEDLYEAHWAVHRVMRRLDDIKADPKYENTSGLKATHTQKDREELDIPKDIYAEDTEAEWVELFEIYDKRERRIKVVASGHEKFLRNEEDTLHDGEIPFEPLVFNDEGDSFWGISDCKIIEPQQLELNEIRTQYQQHRKISLMKLLVQKGAISPEEKEKLLMGDPGVLVEVNDLHNSVEALAPHIPPDLLMAAREARQDIRETVGFSRNQMGEFDDSTRRTATEASIVQQASLIRVDERRDVAADLFGNAVARMNRFIFENWSDSHVVQILGHDGARHWVSYTGAQIKGDYDIRVDPESSLPVSKDMRKQEAIELFQALGQVPPEAGIVNHRELARYLIEQYEGANPDKILQPEPESPGGSPETAVPLEQYVQQSGGAADAAIPLQMSTMPR